MLKQLIFLILALTIFATTAMAETRSGLKVAFDELQYGLTVEWDQKDHNFYNAQVSAFEKYVTSNNVTAEEVLALLRAEVKNEQELQELLEYSSVVSSQRLSPSELREILVKSSQYSQGANWMGQALLQVAGGVLGMALLYVVGKFAVDCVIMNRTCHGL